MNFYKNSRKNFQNFGLKTQVFEQRNPLKIENFF